MKNDENFFIYSNFGSKSFWAGLANLHTHSDLRLTWGSKGKKVGWKLEGGWTWLGPPSKFQHISVPTPNLNLTFLLVITKFKGPRGLKFLGKPPRYLWIDQWIQRHWGRLRFRDFQISETPEATKLRSKTRLFGVPPGNSGKINMGGDMNNFLFSRSRNGYK